MPTAQPKADTIARNALVILAVIAGGATLYFLAPILTPLALAMFLAVMIDGFARVLEHRLAGVSRRAARVLVVNERVVRAMFGTPGPGLGPLVHPLRRPLRASVCRPGWGGGR